MLIGHYELLETTSNIFVVLRKKVKKKKIQRYICLGISARTNYNNDCRPFNCSFV